MVSSAGCFETSESVLNSEDLGATRSLSSSLPIIQRKAPCQMLPTLCPAGMEAADLDLEKVQTRNHNYRNFKSHLPNSHCLFTHKFSKPDQSTRSHFSTDILSLDTQWNPTIQSLSATQSLSKSLQDFTKHSPHVNCENTANFNCNLTDDSQLHDAERKLPQSNICLCYTDSLNFQAFENQNLIDDTEQARINDRISDLRSPETQNHEDLKKSSRKEILQDSGLSSAHASDSLLLHTNVNSDGIGRCFPPEVSEAFQHVLATESAASFSIEGDRNPRDDVSHSSDQTTLEHQSSLPLVSINLTSFSTINKDKDNHHSNSYLFFDSRKANLQKPLTAALSSQKEPINKLSIRERKRLIVSAGRSPALTAAMRLWHKNTSALLDPFRPDWECWLHPCPPRPHLSLTGVLRPHGKLQKTFMWQDLRGRHSLVLNFGIVTKLIYHNMSKQQQDGFINKQWHLSHLCGNWVCVNPKHATVELGMINISRNTCFSHRSGCLHDPPCMKEMKIALGADGKPVDHNANTVSNCEARTEEWDDWSLRSMGDEESMVLDDEGQLAC